MATPRAAVHRDLEQRLRDLERTARELTSAALRRGQQSVTSGDFVVSGGGNVLLRDAGALVLEYPNGVTSAYLGDLWRDGTYFGTGLLVQDDEHNNLLTLAAAAGGQDGDVEFGEPGKPLRWFTTHVQGYDMKAGTFTVAADHADVTSAGGLSLVGRTGAYLRAPGNQVQLSGRDLFLTAETGGRVYLAGPGVSVAGDLAANGGLDVFGTTRTGELNLSNYPTIGTAANVHMGAGGRVFRVQSSLRFKTDVADAVVDPEVVLDKLRGRVWRDKEDAAENPDTARWNVGYIAEEVHDAGLGQFVMYDPEGRPDGIAYDRLTVPLLAVAKRQREQLDAQAEQLSEQQQVIRDLVARVESLEARAA